VGKKSGCKRGERWQVVQKTVTDWFSSLPVGMDVSQKNGLNWR
jgi:phosphate/sulfate permease